MTRDLAREVRRERVAADPVALCTALGLTARGTFKRQTRGLLVRCVAHEEKTPSLSVVVAKDGTIAARCFGCGWTADAIGLVAKARDLDFKAALAELARIAGDHASAVQIEEPASRTPEAPTCEPATYHAIASALLQACPLDSEPVVVDYLRARGLLEEARAAGLGALPRAQTDILAMLLNAFDEEQLERAGLVVRGAIAWSAHRLLIPWRGRFGRISVLQRRAIETTIVPKYVFPKGLQPRTPFGADVLRDGDVVFTEGVLDALSMRTLDKLDARSRTVLAVPSATTWRAEWSELAAGRDVYIAFDADYAGDAAAERFAREVCGGARRVFRERPHSGKDVNEVLLRRLAS